MRYTRSQREAIDFKEGNLQIIACAGSGKTDVISRRIAELVKEGAEPGSIVAFTFTEKAAEEMKFRVRKHMQDTMPENPETGGMYIGTIHSFCYELLKEFRPEYRGYDILDEHKRMVFISNYANFHKIGLNNICGRKYGEMDKFCRTMDVIREEMINPEKLPEDLRECYIKYLNLLNEHKFLDFSGMMYEVFELMQKDSEFRNRVRKRCKYIIVDEYQDINPIQEEIIRMIAGKNGNLCVVGDDDQSIYQWRGTDVSNILTFKERYDNVKLIEISTNFRSGKAIVNSARKLIERNKERLAKDIEVWNEGKIKYEPGDIYAVFFDKEQDEVNFVVNRIRNLIGTKYINNKGEEFSLDYRDIAVFFRSVKRSAEPYIQAFKEKDIPYIVKGGGKLFQQDEVLLAVKSLAYLGNYSFGNDGGNTTKEIIELYSACFGSKGNASEFIMGLSKLRNRLDNNRFFSLQEVFQRILELMGATKFDFTEAQYYNLGMLSRTISDFEFVYKKIKLKDIKYFLGFIRGYGEWNYEEGGSDDPTKINAVKIMTIHRAKGLQFPVVFMPNLVSGRFPSTARPLKWYISENLFNSKRYLSSIEDERRLFYVAITRSEKYLFISGSKELQALIKGKNPSKFFEEFPKDYAITEDIADPTERIKIDFNKIEPLRGFPTSYSELRYYDRCPFDYKMRFIYGFNPVIAIALGYGRAIHNILNIIHTEYRNKPPDRDIIIKLIDENFFLRYVPENLLDTFKNSAFKIIRNYVEKFSDEFNLVLETEKHFEFALGNALISGSIDLIKKLNEHGELEAIEIVDFKKKDDAEMATDYEKQLKLYAIASLRALNLNPGKATIHHLDEDITSEVDISEEELRRVEKEVEEEIESIIRRNFPKKPDKNKCGGCDWKFICNR